MASIALGRTFGLVTGALALAVTCSSAHAEKFASIVIDADTDTVLHVRHADAPRYPASLTKVMTLYMLFDELKAGRLSLDDKLAVSRYAASRPPSNIRLKAGSALTVNDAISALVTKSANDVAAVVAEHIGGTESRFASLMTVKAAELGLQNTTFRNASGLPDARQLSTARDMALLAEAMLEHHGEYYARFSQQRFAYGGRTYKNHNELLVDVDGVDGIKTGYTRASGFNLMASAERDGRRVIAIMMGGHTSKSRNEHVTALIEAAFDAIEAETDAANEKRVAFQTITDPIAPNAAATPVLNGKPFSMANAPARGLNEIRVVEAAPKPASPSPRTPPRTTPSVMTPAPAAPSRPPIVTAAAPATPDAAPRAVGIASAAAARPLPQTMLTSTNGMTIAEYEAAQFAKN